MEEDSKDSDAQGGFEQGVSRHGVKREILTSLPTQKHAVYASFFLFVTEALILYHRGSIDRPISKMAPTLVIHCFLMLNVVCSS